MVLHLCPCFAFGFLFAVYAGPPTFQAVLDWEWGGSYPAAFEVDNMVDFATSPEDMTYCQRALDAAGAPTPPGYDQLQAILGVVGIGMRLTSYQDWFIGKPEAEADLFLQQSLDEADKMLPLLPVAAGTCDRASA